MVKNPFPHGENESTLYIYRERERASGSATIREGVTLKFRDQFSILNTCELVNRYRLHKKIN